MLTLTTDFGDRDGYVAIIKGIIATIAPHCPIIDITHQIPPQNIAAARFCLLNTYAYFPPKTIHVAVVDPGVGSQRRGIAVEIEQGYLVGPDNGLFSGVLAQSPPLDAVALTQPQYWRTPHPSTTFHGRDIFAPVAAHLANGVPLAALGEAIAPPSLTTLDLPPLEIHPTGIKGTIQAIDHFGNLITTIPGEQVSDRPWGLLLHDQPIPAAQTYSDRPPGEILPLIGSHGWVEIAVNGGSAQASLGWAVGDECELWGRSL